MTEPLLLRVEEVARALALGRSKVYELIASGELPSLTIGSARRVPAEALHRWIDEHLEPGAREAG
ncbi:MAG: helix-turn-helix domain-containing protein [Candidatus Limnocylindria bacterium]